MLIIYFLSFPSGPLYSDGLLFEACHWEQGSHRLRPGWQGVIVLREALLLHEQVAGCSCTFRMKTSKIWPFHKTTFRRSWLLVEVHMVLWISAVIGNEYSRKIAHEIRSTQAGRKGQH